MRKIQKWPIIIAAFHLSVLMVLSHSAIAQQEQWRQVQFRPPSLEEQQIIFGTYRTVLRRNPETEIEVADLDINSDGTVEILVRLKNSRLCGNNGCYTALLMRQNRSNRQLWTPILERRSLIVETGAANYYGSSDINVISFRINNREIWSMNSLERYVARAHGFGALLNIGASYIDFEPISDNIQALPSRVLRIVEQAVNREFGTLNPLRPISIGGKQINFEGITVWIVEVSSGDIIPSMFYIVDAHRQERIVGAFRAHFVTIGEWPNGEPLIAAETSEGVSLYAFARGRLTLRETTFPSSVTPTP